MKKILILGANGRIARIVEHRLLTETDAYLTLVLRNAKRLTLTDLARVNIIEGDVHDSKLLDRVMVDQDIIYANLAGDLSALAQNMINSMLKTGLKKLIWITGSGLYHETTEPFGTWVEKVVGHAVKEDSRQAAKIIENAALQYTIIRAAYMTNDARIDYELTQKGTTFKGTLISRASVADLILKIIANPSHYARTSLGISQPGTDKMLPQIKAWVMK